MRVSFPFPPSPNLSSSRALNFFSGCVRSPIRRECGSSAWQVIYRVLKDTTNTLMPACQFTGTSVKLSLTTEQPKEDEDSTNEEEDKSPSSEIQETSTTEEVLSTTTTTTQQTPAPRKPMRKNIINSELVQMNSSNICLFTSLFIYFFMF